MAAAITAVSDGILIVLSAPSGAGKTSLAKALIDSDIGVYFAVSHTTRAPRPGEVDGRDYYFVDDNTFDALIAAEAFVEYANVFDKRYGTSIQTITRTLSLGEDVLLELDWQGAAAIKRHFGDRCATVFILPPSLAALRRRLQRRGQDDAATIDYRMSRAIEQMRRYQNFEYVVVNDDFAICVAQLRAIIVASRQRTAVVRHHVLTEIDDSA